MNAVCDDDNKKIVIRTYKYEKILDEFKLCKTCCSNSDFDGFISETPITNSDISHSKRTSK